MAPTGRKIQFETVDVMRVRDGKITEHGAWPISSLLCSNLARFPSRRRCKSGAMVCLNTGSDIGDWYWL